jgi:hypothetical protein
VLIFSRPCQSPCWTDMKLECLAARNEIHPRLLERLQARAVRF